jgi:GNAT superfamily N-acetyltransferase
VSAGDHDPTLPLLRRCDSYLDAVPSLGAEVVDVGPLRVFVSQAPYPYYVRPRPHADLVAPGSVTAEQVRRAAAVLEQAGHPVSFEWVAELAPALGEALRAEGYAVHHHPLLVRDLTTPANPVDPSAPGSPGTAGDPHLPGTTGAEVPGVTARLLGAHAPELRDALAVQGVGFSVPGTARGEAGVHEREADTVEDALLDYVRGRIAAGRASVAVADDPEAGIVACGWHQPVGADTEVVGVATLPAYRRRGAAAAVLEVLVADAAGHGVTMALLSAGDDAVARIYERSGFTRIGRTGAAEPQ